jgi:hypothetical protein
MPSPRGIFRLKQVYEEQLSDNWSVKSDVWLFNPTMNITWDYAYFGGGGPSLSSRVDRIDYSNDTSTASPKGPLSAARFFLATVGNKSYGYFGGGFPPVQSRIDRIDYPMIPRQQ